MAVPSARLIRYESPAPTTSSGITRRNSHAKASCIRHSVSDMTSGERPSPEARSALVSALFISAKGSDSISTRKNATPSPSTSASAPGISRRISGSAQPKQTAVTDSAAAAVISTVCSTTREASRCSPAPSRRAQSMPEPVTSIVAAAHIRFITWLPCAMVVSELPLMPPMR